MLTRRWFLAGLPLLAAVTTTGSATVGHMTLIRWNCDGYRQRGCRVLLDGEDVTNDAFEFDDREGWVRVYQRNEDGRKFLDPLTRKAAQVRLRGRVTLADPT